MKEEEERRELGKGAEKRKVWEIEREKLEGRKGRKKRKRCRKARREMGKQGKTQKRRREIKGGKQGERMKVGNRKECGNGEKVKE